VTGASPSAPREREGARRENEDEQEPRSKPTRFVEVEPTEVLKLGIESAAMAAVAAPSVHRAATSRPIIADRLGTGAAFTVPPFLS